MKPCIAILSFPGNNGDTENLRAFWRNGFDAFVFRWNDSREKLMGVDGYFIGAGFSFEDRGRAGMVAARDPLFQFLHEEAERGKVIVGHCNGCQMLVESGLIPLGEGLRMSLARNVIQRKEEEGVGEWNAPGFLNEWVWITPTCKMDRCCASNWKGVMHVPIAHGEGRFVTKDQDLIGYLMEHDQIAFRYCDASGNVSEEFPVTPNGSTNAIAGICNPAGNVVAMMPHAERTVNGDLYFQSIKRWIERGTQGRGQRDKDAEHGEKHGLQFITQSPACSLHKREHRQVEIFIDTIIVNNEERTVEQALRRIVPSLRVKQLRYLSPTERKAEEILLSISLFNPNKEEAYVCQRGTWYKWEPQAKALRESVSPLEGISLIRRDEPDTGAMNLGQGSESGICYDCREVSEQDLCSRELQGVFANPHASSLEKIMTNI